LGSWVNPLRCLCIIQIADSASQCIHHRTNYNEVFRDSRRLFQIRIETENGRTSLFCRWRFYHILLDLIRKSNCPTRGHRVWDKQGFWPVVLAGWVRSKVSETANFFIVARKAKCDHIALPSAALWPPANVEPRQSTLMPDSSWDRSE
jgi:hypothetical protein